MIPKRISYCWFGGGEMSDLNLRCIESWRSACPDYEIVRIDEATFDPDSHPYSKEAYRHGNWSFVSDVARFRALESSGGLYLDTDMELFESLDALRCHRAVCAEIGHGFWGLGILGVEDGFMPKPLRMAFDRLGAGRAMHVEFDRACYECYDLLGDSYSEHDGMGMYGVEYFANKRERITNRTLGMHHEENSWVRSWLNGFEVGADFVPFVVNGGSVDGSAFYGHRRLVGTLEIGGDKLTLDIAELGNYFKNPRVSGLMGYGFRFERFGGIGGTMRTLDWGGELWYD